jgi:DNA-binding response OmpR family regulator
MAQEKILIMDDDQIFRMLLREDLSCEGYAVTSATDANDALALLATDAFALVIADLKLPDPRGHEFIQRVKALSPSPIVVLVTTCSSREHLDEMLRIGVSAHVLKPFALTELRDLLKTCLKRLRTKSEASMSATRRTARPARMLDHTELGNQRIGGLCRSATANSL